MLKAETGKGRTVGPAAAESWKGQPLPAWTPQREHTGTHLPAHTRTLTQPMSVCACVSVYAGLACPHRAACAPVLHSPGQPGTPSEWLRAQGASAAEPCAPLPLMPPAAQAGGPGLGKWVRARLGRFPVLPQHMPSKGKGLRSQHTPGPGQAWAHVSTCVHVLVRACRGL